MKISEVCQQTGLTRKTVRYYEEKELIFPCVEEMNGKRFRDYSEEDVKRLIMIAELRKALFSVEQIKMMLENPSAVPAVLRLYRDSVNDGYEKFTRLRDVVNAIEPESLMCVEELVTVLTPATQEMQLPRADVTPRFRYLDEMEEKMSRRKKRARTYRIKSRWILIAIGIIIVFNVGVYAFERMNSYVYVDGVRYDVSGTSSSRRFVPHEKGTAPVDVVIVDFEGSYQGNFRIEDVPAEIAGYDEYTVRSIYELTAISGEDTQRMRLYSVSGQVYYFSDDGKWIVSPEEAGMVPVLSEKTMREFLLAKPEYEKLFNSVVTVSVIVGGLLLILLGYRTMSRTISDMSSDDPKKRTAGFALMGTMSDVAAGQRNAKVQGENLSIGTPGIALKEEYGDELRKMKEEDESEE